MKDHICSIYKAIIGLLISFLYLLAFQSTVGETKEPTADELFSLSRILHRVGNVLGQHKFFERDRRKENPDEGPLMFMERFPDPPLTEVPEMIRAACDKGVIYCLNLIYSLSYKRLARADLFIFRVSASYYMCWYTMYEEPVLRHFGSECQVPYNKDPSKVLDYRGWDKMPFDCALHNFCPDPCCGSREVEVNMTDAGWQASEQPKGFSLTQKTCTRTKGYPCGITELACTLDFKKNRNWEDLKKNKFNTTCTCGKIGKNFIWHERHKMCVDQDECRAGSFDCEPNSVCRNIESDYYCTCRLGYKFSSREKKCIRDADFEFDDVLRIEAGLFPGQTPGPDASTSVFQWATYFYWLIDHSRSEANKNQRCYGVAIWVLVVIANFYRRSV